MNAILLGHYIYKHQIMCQATLTNFQICSHRDLYVCFCLLDYLVQTRNGTNSLYAACAHGRIGSGADRHAIIRS
jgi:hypothetical protein